MVRKADLIKRLEDKQKECDTLASEIEKYKEAYYNAIVEVVSMTSQLNICLTSLKDGINCLKGAVEEEINEETADS